MTPPTLVGPLLQFFFTDYLIAQRRVSPQTIASYRDTFRLLLQFVDRETGSVQRLYPWPAWTPG
jgi:site-specific recombinase XerD